jgi:hypothetical protein
MQTIGVLERWQHLGVDGKLNVSNGFGVHRICSITEEKCKAWASLVMAAKMADKKITIYYTHATIGGDQSNGVCSEIGSWVTPSDAPYYVQLH